MVDAAHSDAAAGSPPPFEAGARPTRAPLDLPEPPPVRPLAELLGLAVPTVIQMASYTVMQFIDTLMLAKAVGNAAPAAVSNSGGLAFAVLSFGVGLIIIVNALASQSYGQRDFARCGRYLWQGVWFALLYSVLVLPLIFLLPRCFVAFGHSARMVAMESVYLRIMLATASLKLVQTAFGQFMLATNRPNLVMLSSALGVAVNIVAAWVMLFGKLGVEPMGVRGAAWGQVIGMAVEMVTLIVFATARPSTRVRFGVLDWRPRVREMWELIRIGFGSGLQFIVEVLAWSVFANWVFAQLGQTAMEAYAFMFRYLLTTFLPAVGISSAVTALVGRYIGMGRPDLAIHRAHLGFRVTLVWLLLCGAMYLGFRREAITIFTDDPEVIRLGAILMIFAAGYTIFDGMYIVYYGALRGAGDTFWPAVMTAVLCWSFMVGGGYLITRLLPQWSVAGPWSVASVYGVILGLYMLRRFNRGGWRKVYPDAVPDRTNGLSPRAS